MRVVRQGESNWTNRGMAQLQSVPTGDEQFWCRHTVRGPGRGLLGKTERGRGAGELRVSELGRDASEETTGMTRTRWWVG